MLWGMDYPYWYETGLDSRDVVSLMDIMEMPRVPFTYSSLRKYATGAREHQLLGPMPDPVAVIAVRRRLYLKSDIEAWLGPYMIEDLFDRGRAIAHLSGRVKRDGRRTQTPRE